MSIAQPETEIDTTTYFEQMIEEVFQEEPSDGQEARAHIVNPPLNIHIWEPGMKATEIVEIAKMTGQEVVALCGYRWVPKYDVKNLDVCDTCLAIAGEMIRQEGR